MDELVDLIQKKLGVAPLQAKVLAVLYLTGKKRISRETVYKVVRPDAGPWRGQRHDKRLVLVSIALNQAKPQLAKACIAKGMLPHKLYSSERDKGYWLTEDQKETFNELLDLETDWVSASSPGSEVT